MTPADPWQPAPYRTPAACALEFALRLHDIGQPDTARHQLRAATHDGRLPVERTHRILATLDADPREGLAAIREWLEEERAHA
jgi:hypothetical protein